MKNLAEKLTEERELRQKVTKERDAAWERVVSLVEQLSEAEAALRSIKDSQDPGSSIPKAVYYFKMKGK